MIKIEAAQRLLAESMISYLTRLKKMGIKQIGTGNYAHVFQHPTMPDVVVKLLTESDPGYESYVKFCQRNQSNKYCPKILEVVDASKVFDTSLMYSQRGLHLVFMEKLTPITKAEYVKFFRYMASLYGSTLLVNDHRIAFEYMRPESFWKSLASQSKDVDLAEVASFILNAFHNPSLTVDLHDANIMKRGKQIVITDPFSSWELK